MIKLDTPIIIYPDTYDVLYLVRAEVELRNRTASFYLAPARLTEDNIYLGVQETVPATVEGAPDTMKARFPDIVRTVILAQNLANPDPVIAALLDTYTVFIEAVEQILIANQDEPGGLAEAPYQNGTTEWQLRSTYEPTEDRQVAVENLDPHIEHYEKPLPRKSEV